ncbi:MAG: type II secretion system protein [Acidobacteria bacterium]|nr:type II secretion system protein [Acidobacteriota bacterium]
MNRHEPHNGEEGYLLLGMTVMVFLLLLVLSIAAPLVAKDMERQKELEAAHRGQQYARAIQLFYRLNKRYPGSIDQLDETNNQHFLRRHYVDPLTGGEYRLIGLGEQQTKLKGFFGQPLDGLSGSTGLGGSSLGSSGTGLGTGLSFGSPTSGTGTSSPSGTGLSGTAGNPGTGQGSTIGGPNATDMKGGKGAIVGVGTNKKGKAIVAVNGEEDFDKWEFLYDPRIDEIRAKSSLLGGGVASSGGTGLSSPSTGNGSGPGTTSTTSPNTKPVDAVP